MQITVCGRTYSGAANGDMRDKLPEIIGTFHPEIIFPNIGRIEVRLKGGPVEGLPKIVTYYYAASETPVLGNPDAATDTANAIREEFKLYRAAVLRSLFPSVDGLPCAEALWAAAAITRLGIESDVKIETALGRKTCQGVAAIIETAFGFHRD